MHNRLQIALELKIFTILRLNLISMKIGWYGLSMIVFLLCACGGESGNFNKWNELNLLEHGIPFSILAPDSAKVETKDFGVIMKDVTIKGGDDYFVQIFASDANSTDLIKLKADQLNEVKTEKYFSKIVEEFDKGFIYESKKDSAVTYYGFRYLKIQGTKEYIIQNGFLGFFSEEEARSMYRAVSEVPKK